MLGSCSGRGLGGSDDVGFGAERSMGDAKDSPVETARALGLLLLDCSWVGSLDFNFLGNKVFSTIPPKVRLFAGGQQQSSLGFSAELVSKS